MDFIEIKREGWSVQQEDIFYENRFLESWAGSIITNPSTAIVELVANCWDAYATKVEISWPDLEKKKAILYFRQRQGNDQSRVRLHLACNVL